MSRLSSFGCLCTPIVYLYATDFHPMNIQPNSEVSEAAAVAPRPKSLRAIGTARPRLSIGGRIADQIGLLQ